MRGFDPRIRLQERECGRCRWRGLASAGQQCPKCLAYANDYGPVFLGYKPHYEDHASDPDPAKWFIKEVWVPRTEDDKPITIQHGYFP